MQFLAALPPTSSYKFCALQSKYLQVGAGQPRKVLSFPLNYKNYTESVGGGDVFHTNEKVKQYTTAPTDLVQNRELYRS